MFPKKPQEPTHIDKMIVRIVEDSEHDKTETDEFAKRVDQLVKLHKIKDSTPNDRISKDTLAIIAGNLAGIVFILGFERANIVTSKAVGFVMKLR